MWQALNIRKYGTTDAATAVNIDSPPVRAGFVWEVALASLDNESGESVDVNFAVVNQSEQFKISAKATVADGDATNLVGPLVLGEGDQLRAIVTGSANKANVRFLVSGILKDADPPANVTAVEIAAQQQQNQTQNY